MPVGFAVNQGRTTTISVPHVGQVPAVTLILEEPERSTLVMFLLSLIYLIPTLPTMTRMRARYRQERVKVHWPSSTHPYDFRARIAANKRLRSITPTEMSNSGNDMDEVMPALRCEFVHVKYIFPLLILFLSDANRQRPFSTQRFTSQLTRSCLSQLRGHVSGLDVTGLRRTQRVLVSDTLTFSPSLSATGPINLPKAVVKKLLLLPTTRVMTHMDGRVDSVISEWPYDDENVAGMGTTNAHPFGYHPNKYTGGSPTIEEGEEGGDLAGRGAEGGGGPVY